MFTPLALSMVDFPHPPHYRYLSSLKLTLLFLASISYLPKHMFQG